MFLVVADLLEVLVEFEFTFASFFLVVVEDVDLVVILEELNLDETRRREDCKLLPVVVLGDLLFVLIFGFLVWLFFLGLPTTVPETEVVFDLILLLFGNDLR